MAWALVPIRPFFFQVFPLCSRPSFLCLLLTLLLSLSCLPLFLSSPPSCFLSFLQSFLVPPSFPFTLSLSLSLSLSLFLSPLNTQPAWKHRGPGFLAFLKARGSEEQKEDESHSHRIRSLLTAHRQTPCALAFLSSSSVFKSLGAFTVLEPH